MLSLMPPSTETYRRDAPPSSPTDFVVPTSYSVNVDGPAMARPGSIDSCGTSMPMAAHSSSTILSMPRARSAGVEGSS